MFLERYSVLDVAGHTLLKLVPVTLALGIVFALLEQWSACNSGRPWWNKREIVTDVVYWFMIPLMARFVRIGLLVIGAALFYNIHGEKPLFAFYDHGFGPLSKMPLWLQAVTFLVVSDFLLYWIHHVFHGVKLWKYHAVNHSSTDVSWISAARFHPVNIFLGSVLTDVALLLAGISPNVMLWVGPFNIHHSHLGGGACQPRLDLRVVQILVRQPGVPPSAPHRPRPRRQQQFRRYVPDLRLAVRHLLYAGGRATGLLRHR